MQDIICNLKYHFLNKRNNLKNIQNLINEARLTPDGFSYEKNDITNHLKYGGNFDPLSRSYLMINNLLPNKNLEDAVRDFLKA